MAKAKMSMKMVGSKKMEANESKAMQMKEAKMMMKTPKKGKK